MQFLWNLLLAFVWCLLNGRLTASIFIMGFVLGILILRVSVGHGSGKAYFALPFRLAGFLAYFLKEMAFAQLRVAYDIVTPAHRSSPGIVGVPLDARTDAEIAILACLISLTPGTVTLDLSPDRHFLFVHVMFIPDGGPNAIRREIKDNLERRLLELMR